MLIWFSLIITFLFCYIISQNKKYGHIFNIGHYIGLILLNILLIFIIKFSNETYLTSDTERYMSYIVSAKHHNYWNEWISKTCETCSTDSDGNETCVEYDCSYEEEHFPFTVVTTIKGKYWIFYEGAKPDFFKKNNKFKNPIFDKKSKKFNQLINKFDCLNNIKKLNDKKFRLNTDYGDGYRGEIFEINWNGDLDKMEYVTWDHNYENRVQASRSIFKFDSVGYKDIEKYQLVNYPKITNKYKSKSIIGYDSNILDEYINQKNALIASKKEMKVYFIVYYNQPIKASILQEQYWEGGNKNEVVICIGLDRNRNIKWSNVFSWSKNEKFKVEIRNKILKTKYLSEKTFKDIIDYSFENLQNNFKRREFKEFAYLIVEVSSGGIITSIILTIILCISYIFGFIYHNNNN